jgi:transposase
MWDHDTTGDNSRVAKLTADQAREIYVKYVVDGVLGRVVAEEYGVSRSVVTRIKNGVDWNSATAELRKIHGRKK